MEEKGVGCGLCKCEEWASQETSWRLQKGSLPEEGNDTHRPVGNQKYG